MMCSIVPTRAFVGYDGGRQARIVDEVRRKFDGFAHFAVQIGTAEEIPLFSGAGRVSATRSPECSPTPVTLMDFAKVRCSINRLLFNNWFDVWIIR